MAIKPALPPPPGKHSNFINPEDNSVHILIAAVVAPIVAGIFVAMRLVTRTMLTKMLGCDDYISVAALITSIAYSIVEAQLIHHGAGKHIWDVPLSVYSPTNGHIQIAAAPLNILALLLFKLSILLLYLRLFRPSPIFRRTTYTVLSIITVYLTIAFLGALLICRPLRAYWTPALDPRCSRKQHKLTEATTIMNLITDVMVFILPMPMVWSLELRTREKIQVSIVFATGAFIVAVGAVRLSYLYAWTHSKDATWNSTKALVWSILEINVGIITGCLPVLRPLLKRLLPSGKGSSWLISSIRLRFARSLHSNSGGQPSPPSESDGRSSESTTGIASKGGADGVAVARHEERYGAPAGAIGGRGRGVNETTVVGGHTRNGASSRITAKGDVWLEGEEERDTEGHGYGSKNGVLSIRKTVGVDVV